MVVLESIVMSGCFFLFLDYGNNILTLILTIFNTISGDKLLRYRVSYMSAHVY